MKTKRFKVLLISIVIIALPLFITAGGEAGEEGHHSYDWWGLLGKTFNAALLFGGLIYLLRKPILSILGQRTVEVKTDIIEREEELKRTTHRLEEIQQRLDKIEGEVAAMKKTAEEGGNEEKKRIEELGKSEAQRIREITDAEIASKVENSIRDLKAKIADMTIEHFKKDIMKELDEKTHEKIIEKNIDRCGDIIERE